MSSEPNKSMDRPLAAYAEKRRQDAGAPIELHPATRQLLQSEAARLHGGAREHGVTWVNVLTAWWPRLATAGILAAFIGLIGWALFQPQDLREKQSMAQFSRDDVLLAEQMKSDAPPAESRTLGLSLDGLGNQASSPPILPAGPRSEPAAAVNSFEKGVAADEAHRLRVEVAKLEKRAAEDKSAASPGTIMKPSEGHAQPNANPTSAARFALADAAPSSASPSAPVRAPETLKTKQVSLAAVTEAPRRQSADLRSNVGRAYSVAASAEQVAAGVSQEVLVAPSLRSVAPPTTGLGGGARSLNRPIQPPPASLPAALRNGELTDLAATSVRGAAASSEPGARFTVPAEAPDALSPQRVYFRRLPGGALAASEAGRAPHPTNLLTSFNWEQTGTRLRVVDADGSVYYGELQGRTAVRAALSSDAEIRLKSTTDNQFSFRREEGSTNEVAEMFRVSGTNRTLQQRLVIDGQVWREAQASAVSGGGLSGGAVAARAAGESIGGKQVIVGGRVEESSVSDRYLRIEARATLSDGRVVPVQATSK